MASLRISSMLLVAPLLASLLLPAQVLCDNDDEANLLKGINNYRTTSKLPPFTVNDRAACLANKIADDLVDALKKCVPTANSTAIPVSRANTTFTEFDEMLKRCSLDPQAPREGIILPVCVLDLEPAQVLTNYTHTAYSNYLKDSRYIRAGIGSEKDWTVVVLTKNTTEPAEEKSASGDLVGVNWFVGIVSFLSLFLGFSLNLMGFLG